MVKWSHKARQFKVKIVYDKRGRAKATIPAPIIAWFDRPNTLTFVPAPAGGEIKAVFERTTT